MESKTKDEARLDRVKRIIRGLNARTVDAGCSEAEAMANAEKVGELLQQFDLELTEVLLDGMKSEMVKERVFAADDAAGSIITGIGRFCSLVTYRETSAAGIAYVLFGHEVDVELAKYLWEVCSDSMEHDFVKYGNVHGFTKKKRDSFRGGFAHRVHDRLVQMLEQREAERRARMQMSNSRDLVVVKNQIVQAEFDKEGIKLVTTRRRRDYDHQAYGHGHASGGRVNLNNPIADGRGVSGQIR